MVLFARFFHRSDQPVSGSILFAGMTGKQATCGPLLVSQLG